MAAVLPASDEPKRRGKTRVRPLGRHPNSDDADSDTSSDYDYAWPSAALAAHVTSLNRKVGSVPVSAQGETSWTVVGKFNPHPIKLSQQGIDYILHSLLDVVMSPKDKRSAKGEGICIGLNYRASAFVHHKTSQACDIIKQVVDEVRSHSELCTLPLHVNPD